jgi:hypothetical protein
MLISRTTGSASVVPELVYADVGEAVDWLCAAFGFTELWRADGHRARVALGTGVVIIADADAQYGRAVPGGAERQYTAEDLAGHRWTFTEAIADLAPEDWGGTSKQPPG